MKQKCMTMAIALIAMVFGTNANAAVVFTDDFSYADGALVGNGGWVAHSGAGSNPVQVISGSAIVDHGIGSREDVNRSFADFSSGIIQFGIDFVVNGVAPFSGTDTEYFAHFGNATTGGTSVSNFVARLDIVQNALGDFGLGIATFSGAPDAVTTSAFTYGDTITALVSYDIDNDIASLSVGGETLFGADGTSNLTINTFALRQSTSSTNETISIGSVTVTAVPEPSSIAALAMIAVGGLAVRRRRMAAKA